MRVSYLLQQILGIKFSDELFLYLLKSLMLASAGPTAQYGFATAEEPENGVDDNKQRVCV